MTAARKTVIMPAMTVETLPLHEPRRQIRAALVAMGIFAVLSGAMAVASKGFIEGDACTHYLYARFAIAEPHYLTNVWGRPFCTGIYAVPAYIGGRLGVRWASMLISLGIAGILWRVARRQGYRWPALAVIFTLAQPMLFLHSFSELTELPFALLVALALAAYQARRWYWLALLVGIMPTARPEGFGFIILTAIALLAHRRLLAIPLLMLPVIAWSFAGWYQFGRVQPWYINGPLWLMGQWPYAAESVYDRKNFFFFAAMLPGIVGPFIFPALLLGIWRSLFAVPPSGGLTDRLKAVLRTDHRRRVQWIIAIIPLLVMFGHSYLTWRGKMGSNAELRYMLAVSPMWALLMAQGWEWAFEKIGERQIFNWAAVAALLPISINLFVYRVIPVGLSKEGMRSQEVSAWVKGSPLLRDYPRIMAPCRDIYYFLDLSLTDFTRSAEWHPKTIEGDHNGILLIWDPIYGQYNADRMRVMSAQHLAHMGWVPVRVFDVQPGEKPGHTSLEKMAHKINKDDLGAWIVFLSPNDKDGRPTDPARRVPLPSTRPAK